jgi:hypothetical protein
MPRLGQKLVILGAPPTYTGTCFCVAYLWYTPHHTISYPCTRLVSPVTKMSSTYSGSRCSSPFWLPSTSIARSYPRNNVNCHRPFSNTSNLWTCSRTFQLMTWSAVIRNANALFLSQEGGRPRIRHITTFHIWTNRVVSCMYFSVAILITRKMML